MKIDPGHRRNVSSWWVSLAVAVLLATFMAPAQAEQDDDLTAVYGGEVTAINPADIEVSVFKQSPGGWSLDQTVVTDDRGSYQFTGSRAEVYRLKFHDPSGLSRDQYWNGKTDLASADDVRVGVGYPQGSRTVLYSGNQISGRLTGENNEELYNAYVTLYAKNHLGAWTEYRTTQTDSSGHYLLGSIAGGTYRLSFLSLWGQGYLEEFWGGATHVDDAQDIVLGSKESLTHHDASLTVGGRIFGTVTSEAGKPLAQMPFQLYRKQASGWVQTQSGTTDQDGTYQIGRLRGTYRLGFSYENGPFLRTFWGAAETVDEGNDVEVAAGQRISGIDVQLTAAGSIGYGQPPAVSGTLRAGERLSVSAGEWTPSDVKLSYQWISSCGSCPIVGANSAEFTPGTDWGGRSIAVQVTASKKGYIDAYFQSQWSTVLPPLPGTPDVQSFAATAVPSISGTLAVDRPSTVDGVSGWNPRPDVISYQWFIDSRPVPGAIAMTFTPPRASAGRSVYVAVTGSKAGHRNVTVASPSRTVAAGTYDAAPVPKIRGVAKAGKTLKISSGVWWPRPTALRFRWYANGRPIAGATKSSYKIAKKYKGTRISVRVTAQTDGYTTVSRSSRPSGKVKR